MTLPSSLSLLLLTYGVFTLSETIVITSETILSNQSSNFTSNYLLDSNITIFEEDVFWGQNGSTVLCTNNSFITFDK